jgi:MtN3 and saliva related transmembrane protein
LTMPPLYWLAAIALPLLLGSLVFWLDSAYLGLCAAFLTTGSFALQVIHILKTRETRAISLGMYLAFSSGVLMWLAYGLKIGDTPVTIANSITLALACTVLLLKLRNEPRT